MKFLKFWAFSLRILVERMAVAAKDTFVLWVEDVRFDIEHPDGDDLGYKGSFTPEEMENVANAMLDYHFGTPKDRSTSLQEKPLLEALRATKT